MFDEKRSFFLEYSIPRQDKPETQSKKIVRGQMDASGYIIDADEDPAVVELTYILQVCTFGASCFTVASLTKFFKRIYKHLHKQLSRKLRKAASSHVETTPLPPIEVPANPRKLRRTSSDPGERERSASILLRYQPGTNTQVLISFRFSFFFPKPTYK